MLKYDPNYGMYASDVSEVREDVRNVFVSAMTENGKPVLNTEPETPAGQLIDSITAMVVQKDNDILYLSNQFNPLVAEGIWQQGFGKVYFLSPRKAIASSAVLTCVGRVGTVIPRGAQVRSVVDDTVWTCQDSVQIPGTGQIDIVFNCESSGPIAASANTLTKICTQIAGWDLAYNAEPATAGQDEESQSAFEDRRYKSVGLNSRSSLASAYSRIAALDNVIAVAARQNRTERSMMVDGVSIAPHTVYFCVLGGDDEEIAMALYNTVSAGCGYTGTQEVVITDEVTGAKDTICFARPSTLAVKVVVNMSRLDSNAEVANDTIKDVVYQNFYGTDQAQIAGQAPILRVVMDTTLYSSRFTSALTNAGYDNVLNVKLAMPASSSTLRDFIVVPINICPSLSKDDIVVVWKEPAEVKDGTEFGFADDDSMTGFNQAPFRDPNKEPETSTSGGDGGDGDESGGATESSTESTENGEVSGDAT